MPRNVYQPQTAPSSHAIIVPVELARVEQPALLLTCCQLRDEALYTYFTSNLFRTRIRRNISALNRARSSVLDVLPWVESLGKDNIRVTAVAFGFPDDFGHSLTIRFVAGGQVSSFLELRHLVTGMTRDIPAPWDEREWLKVFINLVGAMANECDVRGVYLTNVHTMMRLARLN